LVRERWEKRGRPGDPKPLGKANDRLLRQSQSTKKRGREKRKGQGRDKSEK